MSKKVYFIPGADNDWLNYPTLREAVNLGIEGENVYEAHPVRIGKMKDGEFIPIKRRKK